MDLQASSNRESISKRVGPKDWGDVVGIANMDELEDARASTQKNLLQLCVFHTPSRGQKVVYFD